MPVFYSKIYSKNKEGKILCHKASLDFPPEDYIPKGAIIPFREHAVFMLNSIADDFGMADGGEYFQRLFTLLTQEISYDKGIALYKFLVEREAILGKHRETLALAEALGYDTNEEPF